MSHVTLNKNTPPQNHATKCSKACPSSYFFINIANYFLSPTDIFYININQPGVKMSQLVTKLKDDHATMNEAFAELKKLGVNHSDFPKKIIHLKSMLMAHLKKEDAELYPVLKKAAEKEPSIQGTLNVLAKDMDSIAKTAFDFFEKYQKGGDAAEFFKDSIKVEMAISTRMRREETTLYEIYDKCSTTKAA